MSGFPKVNYKGALSEDKSAVDNTDCVVTNKYSWRTGIALQKYIDDNLKDISKERDFVRNLVRYCRYDSFSRGKVYSLSGLRSTGKSIGMCQCIRRLNNYGRCVYIQFVRGKDVEFDELLEILISLPSSIKYIFIDEISVVRDFVHCSGVLADNFTLGGKKIVVAGRDSYAIECAFADGLFHRCILDNVTLISYQEHVRTIGGNLEDYLSSGGLYEVSSYRGVEGLKSYINTSIVENISSSISKNNISELKGISEEDIRSATYMILYEIIYSNSKKLSFDIVINAGLSDKVNEDKLTLKRLIDLSLGLKLNETIDKDKIQEVLHALERMGVIVKCDNICLNGQGKRYNYHVVIPYLVNNIYSLIIDVVTGAGENVSEKNFSQIQGLTLESVLVSHVTKYSGLNCYFYHNTKTNSEVDLVLLDMNIVDSNAYLVEVKLSSDPEIAYSKGHWVREISEEDFIMEDVIVVSRKIVYMGKTKNELGLINCTKFLNSVKNLKSVL